MEHEISRIHRNAGAGGFGEYGGTLSEWNEHPWTDEQVKSVLEAFESGRKPSIRAYLWILCNLRCEEAARLRVQLISDFKKMKQKDDLAAQSDVRSAHSVSGMETPIGAPGTRSSGAKGASSMARHSALLRRPASGYRVSSAPRARQYGLQTPRLGRADGSGLKNAAKASTPALMTRRILSMLDDAASPVPQPLLRPAASSQPRGTPPESARSKDDTDEDRLPTIMLSVPYPRRQDTGVAASSTPGPATTARLPPSKWGRKTAVEHQRTQADSSGTKAGKAASPPRSSSPVVHEGVKRRREPEDANDLEGKVGSAAGSDGVSAPAKSAGQRGPGEEAGAAVKAVAATSPRTKRARIVTETEVTKVVASAERPVTSVGEAASKVQTAGGVVPTEAKHAAVKATENITDAAVVPLRRDALSEPAPMALEKEKPAIGSGLPTSSTSGETGPDQHRDSLKSSSSGILSSRMKFSAKGWTCTACYVRNNEAAKTCFNCRRPRKSKTSRSRDLVPRSRILLPPTYVQSMEAAGLPIAPDLVKRLNSKPEAIAETEPVALQSTSSAAPIVPVSAVQGHAPSGVSATTPASEIMPAVQAQLASPAASTTTPVDSSVVIASTTTSTTSMPQGGTSSSPAAAIPVAVGMAPPAASAPSAPTTEAPALAGSTASTVSLAATVPASAPPTQATPATSGVWGGAGPATQQAPTPPLQSSLQAPPVTQTAPSAGTPAQAPATFRFGSGSTAPGSAAPAFNFTAPQIPNLPPQSSTPGLPPGTFNFGSMSPPTPRVPSQGRSMQRQPRVRPHSQRSHGGLPTPTPGGGAFSFGVNTAKNQRPSRRKTRR